MTSNILKYFEKNILISVFILLQLLFIVPVVLDGFLFKEVNISQAILWHILLTFLFFLGYQLTSIFSNKQDEKKVIIVKDINIIFTTGLVSLSVFGVLCSILAVGNIIHLPDYFKILLSGNNPDLLIKIKYRVATGGLPGYLKMFGYAPVAIFLIVSSYLNFFSFVDIYIKRKFILVAIVSFLCSLIKIVFTLDRLPILGVMLVFLYSYILYRRKTSIYKKLLFAIIFIITFFLLKFITSSKMNGMSIIEFLFLYCKLDLANFQLLLNNYNDWSFGLNSLLTPLYFIGKAFNYHIHVPAAPNSFWDGPQYFYSYLYMDFGYYIFLIIPLLGAVLYYYQNTVLKRNPFATSIYFIILFCICTTIVIPIFRAVEFWLMIVISIIIKKMIRFSN